MNKENSDTYSVTCQCPRILVFVLAAALVFGAVCVGGVSGAEWHVPADGDLAYVVENKAGDGDTIIITEDIVISQKDPIEIGFGKSITIMNEPGKSCTISRASSSSNGNIVIFVPAYSPIFAVHGGELILSGSENGKLILNGNDYTLLSPGGGAVYVNGGSFIMNDGVQLTNFGKWGSAYTGSGSAAVYVNSGVFSMHGGLIDNNQAAVGGGVYVKSGAEFVMTGGKITDNGHNGILFTGDCYGGGVYIQDDGLFSQSGDAEISGNYGTPADIVYNNPDTTISYTVQHHFQTSDGTYEEDVSFREKREGSWGTISNPKYTKAQPVYVPGYQNKPIEQKALFKGEETVVVIEYDISISYTITIPDSLIIAEDTKTGTLTITPTNLWILESGEVVVFVDSKYDFNLVYEDNSEEGITYVLKRDDNSISQGDEVATFTLEEAESVSLTAEATGFPPHLGLYTDILTFSTEYIDSSFSNI